MLDLSVLSRGLANDLQLFRAADGGFPVAVEKIEKEGVLRTRMRPPSQDN